MVNHYNIAGHDDENTPHVSASNIDLVVKFSEQATAKLFEWFSNSLMKSNAEKYHFLVSINNTIGISMIRHHLRNCWKRVALSSFTAEIFSFLLLKCVR